MIKSSHLRDNSAQPGLSQHQAEQQKLAQRLEMQRRMAPSAAEAQLRVKKLKHETMLASAAAGPRSHTGIFRAACSTDLMFVIDATGSMRHCIVAVKEQVKEIVNAIKKSFFQQADIRVAVVGYRDHGDRVPMEMIDFTSDVDKIYTFLDKLEATGGQDIAEDVLGGLNKALQASWQHQTRCIMHFADAPSHGCHLNKLKPKEDRFQCPGDEPHRLLYTNVLGDMARAKINYVFFRINSSCNMMTEAFFEIYLRYTANCKLHADNEFFQLGQNLARRKRQQTYKAVSNKQYHAEKMRTDGGIYFEEASLTGGYDVLRDVIVNGVMASSSRTAARLTTRIRYTQPNTKVSRTTTLTSLAEDEKVDAFDEAKTWQGELAFRHSGGSLGTATTAVETIAEEDENENENADADADADVDDMCEPGREVEIEPGPPKWNKRGWLDQTTRFTAFSPDIVGGGSGGTSTASVLDRMMASDDNIGISMNELTIRMRTKPFEQGALRLASYARTQESTNPLVIKTYKKTTKRLADLMEDMRIQALCKAYALEFNNLIGDKRHSLDFVVVTCLQPLGGDAEAGDGDGCMSLEPMLPRDKFKKYNNNCGGVCAADSPHSMSAQAFSHFTFERSRGALLVCDLQGVDNILTDPAIHTRDAARFVLSDTNLGDDGFKLFFASHRCNALCDQLRLVSAAHMFTDGAFTFRTAWPTPTPAPLTQTADDAVSVCCANKLCGKIVRMSTARTAPANYYWCSRCWPQLGASTVTRVCDGAAAATGGAYHEFDVSKFFFESQGQLLPTSCPAHGGTPDLPADFKASVFTKLGILKRLFT